MTCHLRTIRLDPSDTLVFSRAAEPGEWAVTGSFLFFGRDPATFEGKERVAFRSGFVGVQSLGFSTLVVVQPITPQEKAAAIEALAKRLVADLGAPDLATARLAAEDEFAFAASLADHPENTLIALHRLHENGEVREQFRTIAARERNKGADALHAKSRAFTFHEIVDEDAIDERVDLVGLIGTKP